MAQINGYKEELQDELQKTDPDSHASRLLAQELERLEKGEDRKENKSVAFIDVHPSQPQNVGLRVRIPVREFPRFNFVGKLIGPKGNTLKRLQEETGCKMAVLGKGSMRDKTKEEEMRKEGGKYSHLNEELHVYVEAFAEVTDGYRRLSHAVAELKKFLVPTSASELDEEEVQVLSKVSPLLEVFQTLLSQQQPPAQIPSVPQDRPLSVPGTSKHSQQPAKGPAALLGLQALQSIIALTSGQKGPFSPTGSMDSPRGPIVPSTGPMGLPRGTMAPPTGPMAPPRGPVAPPKGPMVPPTGPMMPPRGSMAPPRGPMAPPTGSMVPSRGPTTGPMVSLKGSVAPPRGPMNQPRGPMIASTRSAVPPTRPVNQPRGPIVPPTGPMNQPRGPIVPPRGPMISPGGPTLSPRGPVVPPRMPIIPPRGPTVSPIGGMAPSRGPFVPPRGPMVPPRGPAFPPRGPMVPPRGPVISVGGPGFLPRGPMIPPRGLMMPSGCLPFPYPELPLKKPKKERPKPKRKPTPWYSSIREEFHLLKRLRRRAERKWLKSRKTEDRRAFVVAKRKFNRLVEKAKAALEPPKEHKKTDEAAKNSEIIDEKKEPDDVKFDVCEDLVKLLEDESEKSETDVCEDLLKLLEDEILSGNDSSDDSSGDEAMETEDIKKNPENEVGNSGLNLQTEYGSGDKMNKIEDMGKNMENEAGNYRIPQSETGDTHKNPLNLDNNDDIRQQQLQEMMYMGQGGGDAPRGGRGGYRGGPAGRGGPPSAHGAPMRGGAGAPGRGAPGRGGAPRGGGAPPARGASRGRGGGAAPPPAQPSSYDDYGYGSSSRGGGYDDGYSNRGYGKSSYGDSQGDSQYYGSSSYSSRGQSSAAAYDDYGDYDYGDSWGTNGSSGGPMKSSGYGGASNPRSHPYGGY